MSWPRGLAKSRGLVHVYSNLLIPHSQIESSVSYHYWRCLAHLSYRKTPHTVDAIAHAERVIFLATSKNSFVF